MNGHREPPTRGVSPPAVCSGAGDLSCELYHPWLTVSDIAIWIFGDDSEKQKFSARTVLWRLRGRGHRFDTRPAPWEYRQGRGRGCARAYRLVEYVAEAAA